MTKIQEFFDTIFMKDYNKELLEIKNYAVLLSYNKFTSMREFFSISSNLMSNHVELIFEPLVVLRKQENDHILELK